MVIAKEEEYIAEVAIVIVGFRNPGDIQRCLTALATATPQPTFDVFICENGGQESFERLVSCLTATTSCCALAGEGSTARKEISGQFLEVRRLRLLERFTNVLIGCAAENLGYAGGINAWLRILAAIKDWKGVWILNPDTEPAPDALVALVNRAEMGGKAMVGSTILESGSEGVVRFRGGIHWQKAIGRSVAIGFAEAVDAPFDLTAIEQGMECPSGASMYVTRHCIEQIGLMDESYFLFFEDLDWGARAKKLGLGYASTSLVVHQRGTTTGSAGRLGALSRLSIYLQHRNAIHFVRHHYPWTLPMRLVLSLAYALRFLLVGAPNNSLTVLEGLAAGLRGEIGRPAWYRNG